MATTEEKTPEDRALSKRRVKVYKLNAAGAWDDTGTGYVEVKSAPHLVVTGEDDESITLLHNRILEEDVYQQQQETLIVWNEPSADSEEGVDLALSFQEAAGCLEIWDQINEIQIRSGKSNLLPDDLLGPDDDDDDDEFNEDAPFDLPAPNLKNLTAIRAIMLSAVGPFHKERLATAVLKADYIRKLCDVFQIVEDLESRPDLHILFDIFKQLVMLNAAGVLEQLFSPTVVFEVMGALEYDPEIVKKANHREYLKNQVVFKEVVPLRGPLVELVHQTFRMQYMKDVVLPRILDEATFASLNSYIFYSNLKIVNELKKDDEFLHRLFTKMKSTELTATQTRDLLRFLQEMCELGKNLEAKNKTNLYQTMEKHGLFDVLEKTLVHEDAKIRMITTEVMLYSVENEPSLLRGYALRQKPRRCALIGQLIQQLHSDPETGIKNLLTDILRILLDSETMEATTDKAEFLNTFYTDFVKLLADPLLHGIPPGGVHSEPDGLLKMNLLELFAGFLVHHGYRIKYFILQNNVIARILDLMHGKDKHLSLAALRFVRAVVGVNDKFYLRQIVKDNLLAPIVDTFVANANRYNLLNSAILELFAFIKKETIKPLITYFVSNFYDRVKDITYVDTFSQLKAKADTLEFSTAVEAPVHSSRPFGSNKMSSLDDDKFSRDLEESSYFESGGDEDDDEDAVFSRDELSTDRRQPVSARERFSLGRLAASGPGMPNFMEDDDFVPGGTLRPSSEPLVTYGHESDSDEEDESVSEADGDQHSSATPPLTTPPEPATAEASENGWTEHDETDGTNKKKRKSDDVTPLQKDDANAPDQAPAGQVNQTDEALEPPPAKRLKDEVAAT